MITDLTNEAYLSAITVTNIYESFTYNMAEKINWQRCGTKLRYCHPVYSLLTLAVVLYYRAEPPRPLNKIY